MRIRGLEAFGRHGVLPAEQELGQRFVVDLDIELHEALAHQHRRAGRHGRLRVALRRPSAIWSPARPVALLERLAGMIADLVLEDPRARAVDRHGPQAARGAARRGSAETAVTLRRASA